MGVIIRQSIKGTIVNYIGTFIGFLTTFYVSIRFLTTEEIGLTRTFIEAATLIAGLASLGISTSGVKFFPYFKNKEKKHNGFFFYLISTVLLGVVIMFSLILLFQQPIKNYFGREASLFVDYFYLLFPLSLFLAYQLAFEVYSSVLMRIVVPRFVREVLVRIMTLVILLLYAFKYINLDWLIYLFVVSYGIAVLIDLIYISRISSISLEHDTHFVRKPLRKYIFQYTSFIFLSSLGGSIVNRIDLFMIGAHNGLADSGIYTIAFFMAAVVEIPSRSLTSISMPLISEHLKNKNLLKVKDLLKRAVLNQFLIGCFIFVLLWINIDKIFIVLPSKEVFDTGKMVVFFLGLARLCDIIGGIPLSILYISKYYYYSLLFIITLSVLTIVGNYYLIPLYGITGASFTTFLAIFIYYFTILCLLRKKIKIHPFSINMLTICILSIAIIWVSHFILFSANPWLDIILRSALFGGFFLVITYVFKISKEINAIVEKVVAVCIQQIFRSKK